MGDGLILCQDGDEATVRVVRAAGERLGAAVEIVADVTAVERLLERVAVDVVVCGDELSEALARTRPELGRLVVVDVRQSDQMIRAMRHGAFDCLVPPLRTDDVEATLRRVIETVRIGEAASESALPDAMQARNRMVGQSPVIQEVYKLIGLIAPKNVNVLITGESGTGKELVATAIHEHSAREAAPFLAINCAAIPEGLLESELFGHEKGAFTGADKRRIGRFEACDGGTLFLDEIGDMPPATQAKLLRVLQDSTFQRVGGNETLRTDVRIIAATHHDLDRLVEQKRFRADLYFRLKVAAIHMPPLREREVDAVLLAHYIVNRVRDEFSTSIVSFAPEAVRALLVYQWPGNVRELENVIKSALTVAKGSVLQLEHLPDPVREAFVGDGSVPGGAAREGGDAVGAALDALADGALDAAAPGEVRAWAMERVEAALIRGALDRTGGNASAAAELLGISRTTLRKKIAELGLDDDS
jgi:two-component system nitrogen regulation response regulator GlnG